MLNAMFSQKLIFTKESDGASYRVRLNPLFKPFITEVKIPAEHKGLPVRVIAKNAFMGAKKLKSISIPASIKYSCAAAFYGCDPESIHITDLKAWCDINFEWPTSNPTHCGENLYLNGKILENIDFDGDVRSIGNYAFFGYEKLKSVSFFGVEIIGKEAFEGCGLSSVTLPQEVACINDEAFRRCSELTEALILGGSDLIGDSIFSSCSSLKKATLGSNVKKIGAHTFSECSKLTSVKMGDSVVEIGNYAFSKCSKLKTAKLPHALRTIGDSAFQECNALKEIELPNELQHIGKFAFDNSGIDSITIPHGVDSIQTATFQLCKKLEEVKIPGSVTRIEKSAFHLCDSLKTVNYAGTAEEWEKVSFPSGYPFKNSVRIYCYESSYHGKNAE